MPDTRHMDTTLNMNIRRRVADEMVEIVTDFCRAVTHPIAMKRLEDAFVYHLDSYITSSLQNNTREASSYRVEIDHLIRRAKEISKQKNAPKKEFMGSRRYAFHLPPAG